MTSRVVELGEASCAEDFGTMRRELLAEIRREASATRHVIASCFAEQRAELAAWMPEAMHAHTWQECEGCTWESPGRKPPPSYEVGGEILPLGRHEVPLGSEPVGEVEASRRAAAGEEHEDLGQMASPCSGEACVAEDGQRGPSCSIETRSDERSTEPDTPELQASSSTPVTTKRRWSSRLRAGSLLSMGSQAAQSETTRRLKRFVSSMGFECTCAAVIFLNCICMGVEAHQTVTHSYGRDVDLGLALSEHFFTAFFLIEFLIRVKADGWRSLVPVNAERRSNFLDAILVLVSGVFLTWLLPLATWLGDVSADGNIQSLSVLRAFRLARLVRVFRKVPLFREAWMLIRGLSDSVRTLLWTVVVIFFVTYVFAIFGLVLMVSELLSVRQSAGPEDAARIDELMPLLGGLDNLMYTLIQILTLDSFHDFMRDILRYVPWSWVYWYSYMAFAVFVLMNLVTAIIVENAMASSQSDHEHALQEKAMKRKRDLTELRNLFLLMDADGSGTLSWDEFQQSFADPVMKKKWMLLDFQAEEGQELFKLLDDGDGEIETAEFFDGLTRMKGPAQAKDVYRLQKSIAKLREELEVPGMARSVCMRMSHRSSKSSSMLDLPVALGRGA